MTVKLEKFLVDLSFGATTHKNYKTKTKTQKKTETKKKVVQPKLQADCIQQIVALTTILMVLIESF